MELVALLAFNGMRGFKKIKWWPTLKARNVRSFSPGQSEPKREVMNLATAVISGVT